MYTKSSPSWLKHIDFLLIDLVCLHISYCLAYIIRNGMSSPYTDLLYLNMAVIITMISILVSVFFETFSNVIKRGLYKEVQVTLRHVCLVVLLASFCLFAVRSGDDFSRIVLFVTGGIYAVLTLIARLSWKEYLRGKMNEGGKRSLLIVTSSEIVHNCVQHVKANNYQLYQLSGISVIDEDRKGTVIDGVPVVADKADLADYVCREWIDEVFIDLPDTMPVPQELVDKFTKMGVIIHLKLARDKEIVGKKQFVEKIGTYTVLTTTMNYATPGQLFVKRFLDILGGLAGCLITGILYLIIAPIIWMQSPGPVFFSQERIGKNGRKFKIYKFRTMYMDAEKRKKALMEQNRVKDGMMFKLDFDPRIIGNKVLPDGSRKTGIGEFMRRISVDEFPQFFNVLKGDMSLVGTRPPTVDEWEKYELHHRARLAAKPGITGMWQVSGRSNITDFEEVVKLDTQYINEWNMGLDFKILFKTVAVVFKKEGAM